MAQLDVHGTGDQEMPYLIYHFDAHVPPWLMRKPELLIIIMRCRVLQHSFVDMDHEIFSMVIFYLSLIQEE